MRGPVVVVLSEGDAAALGPQLVQAIRLAFVARGAPPPRLLLDLSEEINRAAGRSARTEPMAVSPQVSAGCGTAELPAAPDRPSSGQPVGLMTAIEAAEVAQCSASYIRRVIRRGDVQASRDRYGMWRVDPADLAAWLIQRRRKENERKAA